MIAAHAASDRQNLSHKPIVANLLLLLLAAAAAC